MASTGRNPSFEHVGEANPAIPDALPEPINVWDRHPGESNEAYEAFWTYIEMGQNRSHVRVAARLGKSVPLMSRWAKYHKWRLRSYQWDLAQDRVRQDLHRDALDKMAQRHAAFAQAMNGKIIKRLKEMDVDDMTPRDLAQWFKILVAIERHARGAQMLVRPRRGRPPPPLEAEDGV